MIQYTSIAVFDIIHNYDKVLGIIGEIHLDLQVYLCYHNRARSSVGRALHLQCRGQEFESPRVHPTQKKGRSKKNMNISYLYSKATDIGRYFDNFKTSKILGRNNIFASS